MVTFNSLLKPHMTEVEVLSMVAQSSEFESMMVREVRTPHCLLSPPLPHFSSQLLPSYKHLAIKHADSETWTMVNLLPTHRTSIGQFTMKILKDKSL